MIQVETAWSVFGHSLYKLSNFNGFFPASVPFEGLAVGNVEATKLRQAVRRCTACPLVICYASNLYLDLPDLCLKFVPKFTWKTYQKAELLDIWKIQVCCWMLFASPIFSKSSFGKSWRFLNITDFWSLKIHWKRYEIRKQKCDVFLWNIEAKERFGYGCCANGWQQETSTATDILGSDFWCLHRVTNSAATLQKWFKTLYIFATLNSWDLHHPWSHHKWWWWFQASRVSHKKHMVNLWKRSHQPKHQRLKIHLHWRQMRLKNADQWGSHLTTGGAWPPMLNSQLESSPHQELQGKDHPVINNRFYIPSKKTSKLFQSHKFIFDFHGVSKLPSFRWHCLHNVLKRPRVARLRLEHPTDIKNLDGVSHCFPEAFPCLGGRFKSPKQRHLQVNGTGIFLLVHEWLKLIENKHVSVNIPYMGVW